MQFSFLNSTRAVTVAAVTIVSAIVLGILNANQWEPSVFAGFGEDAGRNTEYVLETLGPGTVLRSDLGHDGRFFFIQALDPLITQPALYEEALDRPSYRAQRMLYPLIAGGFGLLPATSAVWGMLLVNALGLIVGTIVTARLAVIYGLTPWLSMAFLVNPGMIDELVIGGAGILALTLLLSGTLALEKAHPLPAGLLLLGAVLAREVMLLPVAASVAYDRRWSRPTSWQAVLWPVMGAAAWYLYVGSRLSGASPSVQEITPVPFGDVARAVGVWLDSGFALALGFVVLSGGAYTLWRAARTRMRVLWITGSFAVLVPFLTVQVLGDHFNLSRAVAPLLIAVLFAFADQWYRVGTTPSSEDFR